jgi:hypothetical protein
MTVENTPDTIVLIHGLWVTPRSWEHWIDRYEGRGYRVLRGPLADRGVDGPRSRRALRGHHRRAREPPDPHGPLDGWPAHSDPARPRLRRRGCGDRLGAP